jgi:hypothetical protein
MSHVVISILLAVSLALIHFAYVDFRFRYREGILWFWLLHPAPPLMWLARVLIVAAVLLAASLFFIGTKPIYFWIMGGLFIGHLLALILLEVLEPR